ncbi:MAG: MarR family transcriptional regulator [Acidobacteria bacterium]|nr:MarR family transcriptional regulator [Acidobacteriota bacterium]
MSQTKPFSCREEDVFLNLARSYEYLLQGLGELFKAQNISTTQYNILRILRGAGEAGLNCTEAAQRMISHDPDITRLLDRLEARNLIERSRSATDRRVVMVKITQAGLDLLQQLDQPLLDLHAAQMERLNPEQLEELIGLLELLRP